MLDMSEYDSIVRKLNVIVIYSGPMWEDGIKGLAELLKVHLERDNMAGRVAKAIFSAFIEQATNVLMYSAQRQKYHIDKNDDDEVPMGMLVLGHTDKVFFIQSRNAMKNENIDRLKTKIDHLNTLDKQQLRQLHKETMRNENDNPESKGAGLGLIEIARRATAPIKYSFEQINENISNISMYVEIAIDGGE